MMRRRPVDSTAEKSERRERRQKVRKQKSSQAQSTRLCLGLSVIVSTVFIWYLYSHYNESRSRDPFTGRKIQPFEHVRDKILKGAGVGGSSSSTTTKTTKDESLYSNGGGGNKRHSLLTIQEDEELETDSDHVRYHLVFSTDCTPYQHWQSYLVYFTAMSVKQPGHVTRIASGCNDEEAIDMQNWFDKDVAPLSKRFHLQMTPSFSEVKNEKGEIVGDYKFFNKPFGLKYWLENSPQINYDAATGKFPDKVKHDIVILTDPDMGLLRPLTRNFSNDREVVIGHRRKDHIISRTVGPGKPFAQVYGFGVQWSRLDLEKIAGEGTPASKVNAEDGFRYYPVGPPYMGTVEDMHKIATKWSEFVPGVYEQYPHLLAEMFAYCIAAAHLELPHQLIDSLMISDVTASAEGWPLIDNIPPAETCDFARRIDHDKYAVPGVVHLCQRYGVGNEWFFSKRRIPSDVYDCDAPLFAEPPADLATMYDYREMPHGERKSMTEKESNRYSFMLCYLYGLINDAATFYKEGACPAGTANLQKTRNLVEYMIENNI